MRSARKGWGRLGFVIALVSLVGGCVAPVPSEPPGDAVVYVIERGWHTDIGLPVEEIAGPLATLEKPYPGVTFLVFGFGERQFLVTRKKDFGAMLNALLPSHSALLLTALRATPEVAFGQANVVALHVSRAGLERIVASIWQEFELSATGEPTWLAEGPYPGSAFYAARETYSGFYTCNTWTAENLRAGGVAMPVAGVLFSGQVMGLARWIGARQAASR
jgi:uncharacterized protein (TIGR02117 family)